MHKKKEALPGLIGGKLDALPWRWCPLSGTRPAPFASRRSVAALGWSAMPFRRTLGRLSLTSRPERVARGTLGGVPLPFPRGTRSGVLPPFHGLIITEVVWFVNLFFKFFRFFFYGRTENLRSPLLIAFRPQGGVGALGTAIGMGLWDEPLRTLAPPAALGEPWAAYL